MSVLWLVLALLPILGGAERFSCRGRILGAYYADAKSGCKAFHVCVRVAGGGIRDFRFFCPPGTLFHQEAQTCTDWGDDAELACPVDLYDGQFDLYKIGSGFDTKKLSSSSVKEEEQEFGLQQAETGDRRLQQNSGASDLRAAHSSDFFSGQRERGRDDSVSSAPSRQPQRTSFRQPTTKAENYFTTKQTESPSTASTTRPQYEERKRKLVRKRPIYYSTTIAPMINAQSSPKQQFPETNNKQTFKSEQFQQNYPRPEQNQQQQQNYPKEFNLQQKNYQKLDKSQKTFLRPEPNPQNFQRPEPNVPKQEQPNYSRQEQQYYPRTEQQNYSSNQKQQQNYQRPALEQKPSVTAAPANVPLEYKEEYVEVSRVTPKSRNFKIATTPATVFSQSTIAQRSNYETPSTASFNPNLQNVKPRNNFNVAPDVPRTKEVPRKNVAVSPNGIRSSSSTVNINSASPSTVDYRNINSVTLKSEKNNYSQFTKQYFNSPSTTPSTAFVSSSSRPEPPQRLNTVAYNTNIGFNAQPINYSESEEDDGQYRPPQGEDDGQYRPELYEKELLSGAHSLNIAASGNRLPEDQKPRSKPNSQAAPRPFRPAPTQTSQPSSTTRAPEPTYTTTFRPQTFSTQRTFDYFQTYTTTARPELERIPQNPEGQLRETSSPRAPPPPTNAPSRAPTHAQPATASRAPAPPTAVPSRAPAHAPPPPSFARPVSNKEDNSYDYAYYDTDSGVSDYDQIEEFGRTSARKS